MKKNTSGKWRNNKADGVQQEGGKRTREVIEQGCAKGEWVKTTAAMTSRRDDRRWIAAQK
jgi:hypothetical protein